MRLIALVLLAATIGLIALASHQSATIKEQETQLAAANDRLTAESIAVQSQCAKQARLAWLDMGFTSKDLASYQNHFNVRLKKCMVYLQTQTYSGSVGIEMGTVFDAFENRDYGKYMWKNSTEKKYYEVAPLACDVESSTGESQTCHSKDEFEQMIKVYMEG